MADSENKPEGRGFTVQDRRRFTPEGETRSEQAPSEEKQSAPSPTPSPTPPIEINFTTFLLSLGTQALIALGEGSGGGTPAKSDPVAARELIDILAMLKEKTKGNLDANEAGLAEALLYDLRLKYVELIKRTTGK